MQISPYFFYPFAACAIAFSLLVVLRRSAIACAFSLVLVFFSFAGIYAMLDAHLIAALQVLVYAGAIMVLFVFVIMLLNVERASFDVTRKGWLLQALGGLVALCLLAVMVWAFQNTPPPKSVGPFTAENIALAGGNTRVVSELMFSEYLLPFELTSVLLLAAMVGAVAIAKRKPRKAGGAK